MYNYHKNYVGESITERGKLFHNLITEGKKENLYESMFVQSYTVGIQYPPLSDLCNFSGRNIYL